MRRHLRHHSPETVALVTSLPPQELNAAQWLKDNRAACGIESGLHQRLDVSHLDDQCRVRRPESMRVMGMFRRLSNSLFMHWRSRQKKSQHKTTTDFFSALNAEHALPPGPSTQLPNQFVNWMPVNNLSKMVLYTRRAQS